MNTVKHVYKGIKGLKAIAEAHGTTISTLSARLRRGYTLAEAVEKEIGSGNRYATKYQYQGASGLVEIAEKTGISITTLHGRVSRGMSIEEAVEKGKPSEAQARKGKRVYEWNGHKGLRAISEATGINRETLRYRVCKGMTIEQAIEWEKGTHTHQGERAPSKRHYQKTTNPDLLNNSWRLALGMRASA